MILFDLVSLKFTVE